MKTNVFKKLSRCSSNKRLICFPFLGGSENAFNELANYLEGEAEVWSACPPGHNGRESALIENIEEIVALYCSQIENLITPNTFFLGYSMGGVIAYFIIKKLLSDYGKTKLPNSLILSASAPPADSNTVNLSRLSDGDLIEKVKCFEGLPRECIMGDEFSSYLAKIYRSDYMILESAAMLKVSPISQPVYCLVAGSDSHVTIGSSLGWAKYFSNELNYLLVKNCSHMFIKDNEKIFNETIRNVLDHMPVM